MKEMEERGMRDNNDVVLAYIGEAY